MKEDIDAVCQGLVDVVYYIDHHSQDFPEEFNEDINTLVKSFDKMCAWLSKSKVEELQNQRNRLNRQIATLKKATLKN